MVVIAGSKLDERPIRMGILGKLADLRLCENGDVYATKRRHLELHQ